MDWIKLLQDNANTAIGLFIAAIVAAIIAFFKKLPDVILSNIRARRHELALIAGSSINNILTILGKESGAMLIHIVSYTNGGKELKLGKPVFIRVAWEVLGNPCKDCDKKCALHKNGGIQKIQGDWNKPTLIAGKWYDVVLNTVKIKGDINKTKYEFLDKTNQKIWDIYNINFYKEALIKHTSHGFITLGLSYCNNIDQQIKGDGIIFRAAKRLRNLM